MRSDNRLVNRIVDFLTKVLMHGGVFIFMHWWDSFLWQVPAVVGLGRMATVLHPGASWQDQSFGQHKLVVMHNMPLMQRHFGADLFFDSACSLGDLHPQFLKAISSCWPASTS